MTENTDIKQRFENAVLRIEKAVEKLQEKVKSDDIKRESLQQHLNEAITQIDMLIQQSSTSDTVSKSVSDSVKCTETLSLFEEDEKS